MQRAEISAEARRYVALKTRWRHRGRSEKGLDCLGLICVTADHFGVKYHDELDYSRFPDGRLVETLGRYLDLTQAPLKLGQVVVLRDNVTPCHVGITGSQHGKMSLIHATVMERRVVEEPIEPWMPRLRAVFEFPGVVD